jgi:hypothetical protein
MKERVKSQIVNRYQGIQNLKFAFSVKKVFGIVK